MREIEEREDCFILDFDPNDSLNLSQISKSKDLRNPNSPDLSILAEKGQVIPHLNSLSLSLSTHTEFDL